MFWDPERIREKKGQRFKWLNKWRYPRSCMKYTSWETAVCPIKMFSELHFNGLPHWYDEMMLWALLSERTECSSLTSTWLILYSKFTNASVTSVHIRTLFLTEPRVMLLQRFDSACYLQDLIFFFFFALDVLHGSNRLHYALYIEQFSQWQSVHSITNTGS